MSANATTLLTALLSATPPSATTTTTATPNPALQQVLLARMGAALQQAQGQLQQGKGLNMKVDVDVMREFVKNASLLTNHLMAIQQSNIECKQVDELFAEQASANRMCNILVGADKQRKCKVVSDKCVPAGEAAAGQMAEIQELLETLVQVKRTKARAYAELVQVVLQDLVAKTTDQCQAACAQMVSRFGRAVNNEFELFKQQSMDPVDRTVQDIQAQVSGNSVRNVDHTIKMLKQAVKQYNAAAEQALKTLESQQKLFNSQYAKLVPA